MKLFNSLRLAVALIALGACNLAFGQASDVIPTYRAVNLGTYDGLCNAGINSAGQIVIRNSPNSPPRILHLPLQERAFPAIQRLRPIELPSAPGTVAQCAEHINEFGQVAGTSLSQGLVYATRWTNLMPSIFPIFGPITRPGGINNLGIVVGYTEITTRPWVGLANGTITPFAMFSGNTPLKGRAFGVNDSNIAVGDYQQPSSEGNTLQRAFAYNLDTNAWTALPGPSPAFARAINSGGMIVGSNGNRWSYNASSGAASFLGSIPPLAQGTSVTAFDINDQGIIVGDSTITTSEPSLRHAFIRFASGNRFDLNDLLPNWLPGNWYLASARRISGSGLILALAKHELTGNLRWYALVPN